MDTKKVSQTENCPYCGGTGNFFVSSTDANRQTTDAIFKYYQCSSCGLVFMHPIPENMRPFYEGGYENIPNNVAELREIAAKEKYRIESILKYKTGGKLLEIGPWRGVFSCNAKDAGFDVAALEIDQSCVEFLNRVVGVRATQSSNPAETLAEMDEQFDVIVLWHSLEHLPTPWLVVQNAAKRLAPGGILLIAIPNIESYEFSLLRQSWVHLDCPRHLYFYPIQSLSKLCSENGLVSLAVTTTDELSDILSREGWHKWVSLRIHVRYVRGAMDYLLYLYSRRKQRLGMLGTGLTALFRAPSGDVR
ncbi:MAG: class I SAM-dependent methyltransferase [Acidobacteriaceae bacterium]